ncbi:hypothetical protein [Streptomyces pseudogriseolus]|uniref:hypothetical protein n=1 Tax=Streptomyces pseudogriseolus TaxID=36817 RepID=UPI003FA2037D
MITSVPLVKAPLTSRHRPDATFTTCANEPESGRVEEGGGLGLAVFVGDGPLVGEGDFEVRDGEGDGEVETDDGVLDTVAVTVTATGGGLT